MIIVSAIVRSTDRSTHNPVPCPQKKQKTRFLRSEGLASHTREPSSYVPPCGQQPDVRKTLCLALAKQKTGSSIKHRSGTITIVSAVVCSTGGSPHSPESCHCVIPRRTGVTGQAKGIDREFNKERHEEQGKRGPSNDPITPKQHDKKTPPACYYTLKRCTQPPTLWTKLRARFDGSGTISRPANQSHLTRERYQIRERSAAAV